MTTQDCADVLNDVSGERVFTAKYIRGRIEYRELVAIKYEKGGTRKRRQIAISPSDFCKYVKKFHPHLSAGVTKKLNVAA